MLVGGLEGQLVKLNLSTGRIAAEATSNTAQVRRLKTTARLTVLFYQVTSVHLHEHHGQVLFFVGCRDSTLRVLRSNLEPCEVHSPEGWFSNPPQFMDRKDQPVQPVVGFAEHVLVHEGTGMWAMQWPETDDVIIRRGTPSIPLGSPWSLARH